MFSFLYFVRRSVCYYSTKLLVSRSYFIVKQFNIYQDVLKSELEIEQRLYENALYLRLRCIPAV